MVHLYLCSISHKNSVNGLINKKNYEEAFSLLTYCLTKKTETGTKRKFAEEEYESLSQLYVFHVLPKLEKWNEAESFLKNDDVLTDWKKEVITSLVFAN